MPYGLAKKYFLFHNLFRQYTNYQLLSHHKQYYSKSQIINYVVALTLLRLHFCIVGKVYPLQYDKIYVHGIMICKWRRPDFNLRDDPNF